MIIPNENERRGRNKLVFLVDERNLKNKPKYTGGMTAQRGFNYQIAYTCLRLSELLTNKYMRAIRVEGIEDLDIAEIDSSNPNSQLEEYIQLKDTAEKYTIPNLAQILYRFLEDFKLISPRACDKISFRLVVAHSYFSRDAQKLRNKENKEYKSIVSELEKSLEKEYLKKDKGKNKNAFKKTLKMFKEKILLKGRLQIESKESSFDPRPNALKDKDKIPNNLAKVDDSDFLSYQSGFEATAKNNIHSFWNLPIDPKTLQNAFNSLRIEAHEAGSGQGRVFTRKRVQKIIDQVIELKPIGSNHGVQIINKEFIAREETKATEEELQIQAEYQQGEEVKFVDMPYVGKPAEWRDIIANRDIKRDSLEDLIKIVEAKLEKKYFSAIVISGQLGKRSLMKRAALEIRKRKDAFILDITDPGRFLEGGSVDTITKAIAKLSSSTPVIFTLEDVFEEEGHERIFCTIKNIANDSDHSIVFLSTACPYTLVSYERQVFEPFTLLPSVSDNEKEQIRAKFNLVQEQISKLPSDNFFAAMIYVHTKEPFRQTIKKLRDSFKGTNYLFFQHLCIGGRLWLNTPESLIMKLDDDYAAILNRPDEYGLRGLYKIEERPVWGKFWGPCHQVIAEMFVEVDICRHSYEELLEDIIAKVTPTSLPERRFFIHILRRLLIEEKQLVGEILEKHSSLVCQCKENGTVMELYLYWPEIYDSQNEDVASNHCKELALKANPCNSFEVVFLAERLSERGKEGEVIKLLEKWHRERPDDKTILAKFLEKLSHKLRGRPENEEWVYRQKIINEKAKWLKEKDYPTQVTLQYLSLVTKWGSYPQKLGLLPELLSILKDCADTITDEHLVVKCLDFIDSWREKDAKKGIMKWIEKGMERGGNLDTVIMHSKKLLEEWKKEKCVSLALSYIKEYLAKTNRQNIIVKSLHFSSRWGDEEIWRLVLSHSLYFLATQKYKEIKKYQNIWPMICKSIRIRGNTKDLRNLIPFIEKMILENSTSTTQWWASLIQTLRVVTEKSNNVSKVKPLVITLLKERKIKKSELALIISAKGGKAIANEDICMPENETTLLNELASFVSESEKISIRWGDVQSFVKSYETHQFKVLRLNVANIATKAKKFDVAKPIYERLIQEEPRDTEARYHYARALMENGDCKSAISYLREAIKIKKAHGPAHKLLSVALRETNGDKNEAKLHESISDILKEIGPITI